MRIGSRAKERDVKGRVVNPASRPMIRKPFMGNVFRGMVLPLRFIESDGLRIGKTREDVNGISGYAVFRLVISEPFSENRDVAENVFSQRLNGYKLPQLSFIGRKRERRASTAVHVVVVALELEISGEMRDSGTDQLANSPPSLSLWSDSSSSLS